MKTTSKVVKSVEERSGREKMISEKHKGRRLKRKERESVSERQPAGRFHF